MLSSLALPSLLLLRRDDPTSLFALAYQMPSRDVLRCDLGMTSEVFPTIVSGLLAWCCLFKSWLQIAQKTPKSVEHELLYPPTKR